MLTLELKVILVKVKKYFGKEIADIAIKII
jgi:hypothetical protein